MHPRWDIVDKLQELHPKIRIGWQPMKRDAEDDINKGQFILLQLYHKADMAKTMLTPWPKDWPIYGKSFNQDLYTPVMVMGMTKQQMFSGDIFDMVKQWMKPWTARVKESEDTKAKDMNSSIDDISHEAGDYVVSRNRRTGTNARNTAKKHLTAREKKILSGDYDKNIDRVAKVNVPKGAVPLA